MLRNIIRKTIYKNFAWMFFKADVSYVKYFVFHVSIMKNKKIEFLRFVSG